MWRKEWSRDVPWLVFLGAFGMGIATMLALAGCCVLSVRTAVETGDGHQDANTTGAKADLDADVDGAALPLSELGGGE